MVEKFNKIHLHLFTHAAKPGQLARTMKVTRAFQHSIPVWLLIFPGRVDRLLFRRLLYMHAAADHVLHCVLEFSVCKDIIKFC